MDRRIDPTLHATVASLLAPTQGLETDRLFNTSPIEALETLKELGDITKASIEPPAPPAAPAQIAAETPVPTKTEGDPEDRLVEALLEYHRLRNPMLGAKTGPTFTPADRTQAPSERGFSSMEIPVVQDYVPKTSNSPYRSGEPTRSVLKSNRKP